MDPTAHEIGWLDLMFWQELRLRWPSLSLPLRRQILRQGAEASFRLWHEGADLSSLPLDLLAIQACGSAPAVQLARSLVRAVTHPMPPGEVLETLAVWYAQAGDMLSPREARFFLDEFMKEEPLDAETIRHTATHIGAMAADLLSARARHLYQGMLKTESLLAAAEAGPLRGLWGPDPRLPPADLAVAVAEAENDPASVVIKEGKAIRVMRATVLGRDVLVKRYDLLSVRQWLKYLVRPSRARRAWAAGRTLLQLGIPTPEPLGFLETMSGGVPIRSYGLTAFVADAVRTSTWVKRNYVGLPPAARKSFRQGVLQSLLALYRKGVYHGDTKLLNLLAVAPGDAARQTFLWIDLESAEFGARLTRYRLLRNLVQLNGSLGNRVPDEDRMAFLHDLARFYPWLTQPRVVRRIREWTRRRLQKELRLRCGS